MRLCSGYVSYLCMVCPLCAERSNLCRGLKLTCSGVIVVLVEVVYASLVIASPHLGTCAHIQMPA